jgi:hypothetical protein
MLFVLLVLALLIGILVVGVRMATRTARRNIDQTTASNLRVGVEKFKQEVGFIPPLVKDDVGPLDAGKTSAVVYIVSDPADLQALRTLPPPGDPDPRYSVHSLAYYVLGVLDIDGMPGPGLREPEPDGAFRKTGRSFKPFFEPGSNAKAVVDRGPAGEGRIELRDSGGVAYRYYVWLHDAGDPVPGDPINEFLNVPAPVGDPAERQDLGSAAYAIVAAGRNGLFGDETAAVMSDKLGLPASTPLAQLVAAAVEDNIVEVGR